VQRFQCDNLEKKKVQSTLDEISRLGHAFTLPSITELRLVHPALGNQGKNLRKG
jgi:hypothetical protein